MSFDSDLERMINKATEQLNDFTQEFTYSLAAYAVYQTPVRTGFLRGSWFVSGDRGTTNEGIVDPSGAAVLNKLRAQVNSLPTRASVFVLNSAPYAAAVDRGTASISPRAFVRQTVAQAPAIAAEVAARLGAR